MTLSYDDVLEAVVQSQGKVEEALAALTDDRARERSLLPVWSRGHLATHIARNADALNRLAVGVLAGIPGQMYPGGTDARNAAIEEGADRPADQLAADFRFAGRRLVESLAGITPALYPTAVSWRKPITARDLPMLRWRELEIHLVDLDVGYSALDWSEAFVQHSVETQLAELATVAPDVRPPRLPAPELLAWLVGRPTREGLPKLPSWPF
jgi:maleylpyruvate isomerase